MLNAVLSLIVLNASPALDLPRRIEFGPVYSYSLLKQDGQDNKGSYLWGAELGARNILPGIGLKLRASRLRITAPDIDSTAEDESRYGYRYIPVTLAAAFDLLPFFTGTERLSLCLETGLGVCLWQGLYDGEVLEIPTGSMDERDLEFTAGLNLQVWPLKHLALELTSRYHYLASANLEKYGFADQDDKILERGLGLKFLLPLR